MKKNYYSFYWLTFIILTLFGCREESNVINPYNSNEASLLYKKFSEISELKNLETNLKTLKTSSAINIDTSADVIEMNLLDNRKTFSVILENDNLDKSYSIKNLYIINDKNQEKYLIAEYIPENGLPFYNMKSFKGKIVYTDISGNHLKTIYYNKADTETSNKQIIDYIPTSLGCYSYVIAVWSDGTATIYSSVNHCGGSGGSGSGSGTGSTGGNGGTSGGDGGSYGGWPSEGGGGSSSGSTLPAMPNIPSEDYIDKKKYEGFFRSLQELQKTYLYENGYSNDQFFYYLKNNNFNTSSQNFIKWGINFMLTHPNISEYKFFNWFDWLSTVFTQSSNEDLELLSTYISENISINPDILLQDYRLQMSQSELIIFDQLSKSNKMNYLYAAKIAASQTDKIFPDSKYNGKGDAYRHALWNAISTRYLGSAKTEQLTTAHENTPPDPNNPYEYKEKEMDLYNNAIGRAIGISYPSYETVKQVRIQHVNGNMKYLNNLVGGLPSGQATLNSQLIPTNQ